ncbi:hypothetical protein [Marinirhabdus gelatinilytica]|uniref:Uncharacterized protein n=1 Tax=Marinirhabdus gelatinilytica TaxID=1703343 RepID=A0A370QG01_9FLAO|nr:hypothetical protein [Marinirhabdus gelatinilytica]RDK87296.1 hypothetical protein C8D94_102483 [Marinirhabdus gelatinilytica]
MKQITLLVFTLFSISCFSQDLPRETSAISTNEVPQNVRDSQELNFPNSYVREWHVDRGLTATDSVPERYMSKFSFDGGTSNQFATYLPNGMLFFHSKFLQDDEIPSNILMKTRAEYDKFEIQHADFITLYNPKRQLYKVKLRDQTRIQNAYYTVDAISIPKKNLPEELLVFKY